MNDTKYILLDVNIIDGKGNEPLENQAVIIENGRIFDVIDSNKAKMLKGYKFFEMEGLFLLPGLIDTHVHLAGLKGFEFDGMSIHPYVRAYKGLAQAQKLLTYGFTSVRDISWNGLYLKRVIDKGDIIGPRIIACGPGLNRSGGHADIHEMPFNWISNNHFWGVYCDGKEEIRKTVRMLLREGADQIKFWADGGGNNEVDRIGDKHYSIEEMKMIVNEAKMISGTKVCVHAEHLEAINDAVEAGVDSIEHGEELSEEVIEKMIKKGIYLVPTLNLIANWYRDFVSDEDEIAPAEEYGPFYYRDQFKEKINVDEERKRVIANFQLAYKKGVKIALGSDSIEDNSTRYGEYSIKELCTMVEAGMKPLEAIKASTQTASEVLGLEKQIGTIEKGKIADMILIKGDLSKDVSLLLNKQNIQYVFKSGKLVLKNGNLIL